MESWKARARRWEFRAAQRRLERRRKTGESTPVTGRQCAPSRTLTSSAVEIDMSSLTVVRRRADFDLRPGERPPRRAGFPGRAPAYLAASPQLGRKECPSERLSAER
jgi:hypothetical protein